MKLDLGCGKSKREGFTGVDSRPFAGVDIVHDLTVTPWPWDDNSVEEAHASHFVEHLTWPERCQFFNELWRVLKPGAKATIIVPHPFSVRFWGDPTHQAPFSEFALPYLRKSDRLNMAPHCDWDECKGQGDRLYKCDFDYSHGYSLAPFMVGRSQEFIAFALQAYTEARQDLHATLFKRAA